MTGQKAQNILRMVQNPYLDFYKCRDGISKAFS